MAAGLLILRVVVGGLLVGHGTQKLFGWFGGHGPRTTGAFFELLGYRPGVLFAIIAGLGVMLNAASSLRGRGPWVINGGWEYTVVLATVGASIALTGPGSVSADHALGLDWSTGWCIGGVAIGVIAAIATLVVRQPIPAQPDPTSQNEPFGEAA
jgi:putative oxidoreductase